MVRLVLAERELQGEAAARAVQEERLQHAQRLEVLGHLTGAVAHDFNNLLTGLGGTAQALRDRLPHDAEELDEIRDTVRRGTALCGQLLGIGRREPDRLAPLDLREAVEGTLPMLRRIVPRTVEMHATGEVGRARALADRTQIEVALLNLAVNARDAMPRGGTLWIYADAVEIGAGSHWDRRGVPSGRYARLSVSDSGCGMDEVTRRRATEPFFTTKPPGAGTGLGLATVRGVASRCGGSLVIDSAPGRGTSVSLLLPLVGATSQA
jgi:signal transduction histidine kinase